MSRKRVIRIIGAGLVLALFGSMLQLNVAAASPRPARAVATTSGACAAPLTSRQMASVRGGSWLNDLAGALTSAIDGACTVAGVAAALNLAVDPIGGAFCAGWGLGRLLS